MKMCEKDSHNPGVHIVPLIVFYVRHICLSRTSVRCLLLIGSRYRILDSHHMTPFPSLMLLRRLGYDDANGVKSSIAKDIDVY